MKNLKKVLSLVLALAMALSLMTAAFAADASDYSDYGKVTYKEAVDVMTATGVFDGMGGSFNPDGTLTREQAAKIITYMIMGKDAADKLTTTIAPYSDVSASRWSAGAIAYCTNEGILSGVGKGKFDPTGKLTGVAFAKMLLVALGYDPKIEQFTGDSWAINVSKLALGDAALDTGMKDISLSSELTREQAAQMAFNTMQANVVDYENRGTEFKMPDGSIVIIGASKAATVAQGNYNNNMKANGLQFAEKYCEDLKKVETTDDFGRPSTQWKVKTTEIGNYAEKADATYTADVKLGDIYADLGLSERTVPTIYKDGADQKNSTLVLFKSNSAKIGTGNGVLTEAYVDDDNNVTLIEINTYVGQINRTVAATSSKDAYVVIAPTSEKPTGVSGNMNYETNAAFDDDTYVLYTYANNEVQSVTVAESVSGEVSSYTDGKNITVGGNKYDYSEHVAGTTAPTTKSDYVVYLDAYGYAIYVDEQEFVSSDYAYVEDVQGSGTFQEAKAKLVFTNGTTKIVTTDKDYSTGTSLKGDIVTYKVNEDNEYVLRAVSTTQDITGSENFKLTRGTAAITFNDGTAKTLYANSNTVFIVKTEDNQKNAIYNAYTGVANVPSITAGSSKDVDVAYYVKSGSIVTMMYIDATNAASVSTSSKDVTFLAGKSISGKITNSDGDQYYTYNAVVNGQITTVKVDAGTDMDVSGVMTDGKLNNGVNNALFSGVTTSDDIITGLTAYNTNAGQNPYTDDAKGTVKVSGDNTLGFGTGSSIQYFTAANDCKVFYIDAEGVITEGAVSSIATDEDDRAYYVVDDGELTYVFIQSYEKNATDPGESTNGTYSVALAKDSTTSSTLKLTVNKLTAGGAVDAGDSTTKYTAKVYAYAIGSDKDNAVEVSTVSEQTLTSGTSTVDAIKGTNNTLIYYVVVTIGNETLTTSTVIGG